jgi:hypothetical protein
MQPLYAPAVSYNTEFPQLGSAPRPPHQLSIDTSQQVSIIWHKVLDNFMFAFSLQNQDNLHNLIKDKYTQLVLVYHPLIINGCNNRLGHFLSKFNEMDHTRTHNV